MFKEVLHSVREAVLEAEWVVSYRIYLNADCVLEDGSLRIRAAIHYLTIKQGLPSPQRCGMESGRHRGWTGK